MRQVSSSVRTAKTPIGGIEYSLERKKVKNINLRVRRDGTVYVSAPSRVPVREIEGFIAAKCSYIKQAQEHFRSRTETAAEERRFAQGASVMYLGRPLELCIIQSPTEGVTEEEHRLVIALRDSSDLSRGERLYAKWLDGRCREVFTDLMKEIYPFFKAMGVPFPQLKIRAMKARWGSCHYTKGMIVLNRYLIEAPRHCIAHVVAHEFCHFIYPNHSRDFYSLLDKVCPHWRSDKAELERLVVL